MPNFRLEVDPAAPGHVGDALYQLLAEQIGPRIAATARRTVPVETGDLKRSITIQVIRDGDDSYLEVGYDAYAPGLLDPPMDYGLYVELGTSKMDAQGHLKNAVMQARGKIR